MSGAQRMAILAAVAIVAGVGFAVARPDGRGEEAGGAGAGARPAAMEPDRSAARPADAESRKRTPPAAPKYHLIRLRDGTPVGGARTMRVRSGDTVRLAVASDMRGEVHVHGYDRYLRLSPGRTSRTRFRADLEGVFEIELHGPGTPLARLAVEP